MESISSTEDTEEINIQLGDIIEIIAPENEILHLKQFYIKFISQDKIVLVNIETKNNLQLTIIDNELSDTSITSINLLSRATTLGYASQNLLVPGTWIEIIFNGGEVQKGEIIDLEEDMIQVNLYPSNTIIYIDFEYQGLNEELIESITITTNPEYPEYPEQELPDITIKETNVDIENDSTSQEIINSMINNSLTQADAIDFGDATYKLTIDMEVSEEKRRYTIEQQREDLLDDLISHFKPEELNSAIKNIHSSIERFNQLRQEFSVFDRNDYPTMPKPLSNNYKPLTNRVCSLDTNFHWIIPVAKTKNKLYDLTTSDFLDTDQLDEKQSFDAIELRSVLTEENDIYKEYRNKSSSIDDNYKTFIHNSYELTCPFNNSIMDSIYSTKVNSNVLSIIDNNVDEDDNNTYVVDTETNSITPKKHFFEMFTKNLNDKDNNSDIINITSIIVLPILKDINVFNYSKIELPLTNVLQKSVLNLDSSFIYKSELLNKNTELLMNEISMNEEDEEDYEEEDEAEEEDEEEEDEDEENEEDEDEEDEEEEEEEEDEEYKKTEKATLLQDQSNYAQQFKPSKLYKNVELANNQARYKQFLSNVLFTNSQYLELIKPISSNLLSTNAVIKQLEIFHIYKKDVNNKLHQKIVDYVTTNIKNYKKAVTFNKTNYKTIYSKIIGSSSQTNWLTILENQESIKEIAQLAYDMNRKMSNTELLNKIYSIDYGRLFVNSLVRINLDLQTNKLLEELVKKYEDIMAKVNDKENNCKKLTKKYNSLNELEKDNGQIIYVDKEYDHTDYKFINKYINEKVKMEPEEFQNFLVQKLTKKKYTIKDAEKIAQALVVKKLQVSDNDYALVTIDGTNKYYARVGMNWELDPTLLNNVEIKDNKLFCNIQKDCISNETCTPVNTTEINIQEEVLKQIYSEFDKTYDLQATRLREDIDALLEKSINRILLVKKYIDTSFYMYDTFKRKLADMLDISKIVISSPYEKLLTTILSLENFVQRQNSIQKFVLLFTREPFSTEDNFWLYCNVTNTKLIPIFLSKLANAFLSGKEYLSVLEEIVDKQGIISDDGDTYVDKHSGYFIKNINFDTDDGYTQDGFKIKMRDVLEQPASGPQKDQNNPNNPNDPNDPNDPNNLEKYEESLIGDSKIILNVINAMTGKETMKINLDANKKFIIDNVLHQYKMSELTQEQYNKIKKTNKDLEPIEILRGRLLILLTFAYILIAIQISIPNITSNKTFPNCIKGFDGYPILGQDEVAITYISCIAKKIKNDSYPWNSIIKWNDVTIKNEIMFIINKRKLLEQPALRLKIDSKKKYLKLLAKNKSFSPEEVTGFNDDNLQGIYPLNIRSITITPLIDGYSKKLISNMKTGSYKQHEQINVIHSKIIKYGLFIQKLIQSEINKASPLIISKTGVHFIENACCDSVATNVFNYFTELNKELLQSNTIVVSLSKTIEKIKLYSRAPLLYDIRDTKFKYPETQSIFSETTIFQTFIYFCKNKELNLSEELATACGLSKTLLSQDVNEVIAELKSNNINYSNELFQKLLTIVYLKNKATTFVPSNVPSKQETFVELLQTNPTILDPTLSGLLIDLLMKQSNETARTIKNKLQENNDILIKNIKLFIATSVSKKQLIQYIKTIEDISLFLKSDTSTIVKLTTFIQTLLKNIINVLPNIILKNINFTDTKIPKHWDLSSLHGTDISNMIQNHYKHLKPFYNNKELIKVLLNRQDKMGDILKLCLTTPLFNSLEPFVIGEESEEYDERLSMLLYKHYYLKVLDIYIQLSISTSIGDGEGDKDTTSEDEEYESGDPYYDVDNDEIKKILAKYIIATIDMTLMYKETINYNKETIMNKILKAKESEKQEITEGLANLTEDEREVENILKNNKLEKWGVGLQKSLISYDKDAYDEERTNYEQKLLKNIALNNIVGISDSNKDIYAQDLDYFTRRDAENDAEDNQIEYLGENDDEDELD